MITGIKNLIVNIFFTKRNTTWLIMGYNGKYHDILSSQLLSSKYIFWKIEHKTNNEDEIYSLISGLYDLNNGKDRRRQK